MFVIMVSSRTATQGGVSNNPVAMCTFLYIVYYIHCELLELRSISIAFPVTDPQSPWLQIDIEHLVVLFYE